jgi:hypothetical protein
MLVQSQWPTDHYVSDYCTPRLCIPGPSETLGAQDPRFRTVRGVWTAQWLHLHLKAFVYSSGVHLHVDATVYCGATSCPHI